MTMLVHVVVGELDLVEGDVTLHPVGPAGLSGCTHSLITGGGAIKG